MIEEIIDLISTIDREFLGILLGLSLGIFIGIERERSDMMAGVRTFSLISVSGSALAIFGNDMLMVMGFIMVIVFSVLMGLKDISVEKDVGLSLTTSAALLATYIAGLLSGSGEILLASTMAIVTAGLLISKQSLHKFAGDVSKEEFFSALELLAISVIVYPFLPSRKIGPWNSIDLQLVWLLVVAVSGLGFVNYILVKKYEEKGFIATGFFGGLVNSTAVIGTITDRVSKEEAPVKIAVAAILLANSAMALRNALIAGAFIPQSFIVIFIPLLTISLLGILISIKVGSWDSKLEGSDLNSPFSLKNALVFGGIFLIILIFSSFATELFGEAGFYVSMFLAGLVSSGTATTTAVTFISTSQVSVFVGSVGVLIGTVASIVAKIVLVVSVERKLAKPTILWSTLLIVVGFVSALGGYFILVELGLI